MNKNNHGGVRAGAGRKKGTKVPNHKPYKKKQNSTNQYSVNITKEQRRKYLASGGNRKLRYIIDSGIFESTELPADYK